MAILQNELINFSYLRFLQQILRDANFMQFKDLKTFTTFQKCILCHVRCTEHYWTLDNSDPV